MMTHLLNGGLVPCNYTRGDQKVLGKVLLNRNAFIDCNE